MSNDLSDINAAMSRIELVFAAGGPRGRERAVREVAQILGYQRLGCRVREHVDSVLREAIRRGIVASSDGQLAPMCTSVNQHSQEHLVRMLKETMNRSVGWISREGAIHATARHMGYRRVGRHIRAAMKSAMNGAIRRGLIEADGDRIRIVRET